MLLRFVFFLCHLAVLGPNFFILSSENISAWGVKVDIFYINRIVNYIYYSSLVFMKKISKKKL